MGMKDGLPSHLPAIDPHVETLNLVVQLGNRFLLIEMIEWIDVPGYRGQTSLPHGASWQILGALQKDARISFKELGERIGLTGGAVAKRVRKMEKMGIIKGYRAEVAFIKLGFSSREQQNQTPDQLTACRNSTNPSNALRGLI